MFRGCSISLDFILANERNMRPDDEKYNNYISQFCRNPWITSLREMANENEAVRKLLNHKTLKKEITELYGVLTLFERSLSQSCPLQDTENDRTTHEPFPCLHDVDRNHRLVFYDICSGRGISSFFLSFLFPNSRIRMIDSDSKMKLNHFEIPQCQHVKHFNFDIYNDDFYHFLSTDSSINSSFPLDELPQVSFAFGLHLCGTLSLRLCTLFNAIPTLPIIVISPCCMPKNKKANASHRIHLSKWSQRRGHEDRKDPIRDGEEFTSYDYWCLTVYHQLDATQRQIRRDMKFDECVLSERSRFIIGIREPLIQSCGVGKNCPNNLI
jgi:hypothetical protein